MQDKLDVARGGGNVFRDLGHKNADAEQFKVTDAITWRCRSRA